MTWALSFISDGNLDNRQNIHCTDSPPSAVQSSLFCVNPFSPCWLTLTQPNPPLYRASTQLKWTFERHRIWSSIHLCRWLQNLILSCWNYTTDSVIVVDKYPFEKEHIRIDDLLSGECNQYNCLPKRTLVFTSAEYFELIKSLGELKILSPSQTCIAIVVM